MSTRAPEEKPAKGGPACKTPIDASLPARYAETMRRHSRLDARNEPSMSSRVLLLGFLGLLFYYAIQSKWKIRMYKASLSEVEWDKDYTILPGEEAD